jgi:hypothetical protein
MVASTIMMIPGEWEARRRPGAPVSVVNVVGVVDPATSGPKAETERHELPGWIKVSIFAGTLLVAMWLAMTVFFD